MLCLLRFLCRAFLKPITLLLVCPALKARVCPELINTTFKPLGGAYGHTNQHQEGTSTQENKDLPDTQARGLRHIQWEQPISPGYGPEFTAYALSVNEQGFGEAIAKGLLATCPDLYP